jgi:cell division protein ZapA (FtsZ GTPase activity inhibitor)
MPLRKPDMHVEPLEKLPHSLREFMSHHAMIVLSILTALALEQMVVGIEHRHQGVRAKEEIEQEIAANRQAVEESLERTHANLEKWKGLFQRTATAVSEESSTSAGLVTTLREARQNFSDSLPALKTTAWDAALSDHSVNYLLHADLVHVSEVYASQRLFSQGMWDVLRDNAARDLSAISVAIALGKPDPRATVATLGGRLQTVAIIESQLSQLKQMLSAKASDTTAPLMRAASR